MSVSALMDELELARHEPVLYSPALPGRTAFELVVREERGCAAGVRTLTERVLTFMDHYKYPAA